MPSKKKKKKHNPFKTFLFPKQKFLWMRCQCRHTVTDPLLLVSDSNTNLLLISRLPNQGAYRTHPTSLNNHNFLEVNELISISLCKWKGWMYGEGKIKYTWLWFFGSCSQERLSLFKVHNNISVGY